MLKVVSNNSMNTLEAFKMLNRQAPCSHDSTEEIGDGRIWVKCHDCGLTLSQDGLTRARETARNFEDAVAHLQALVG